MFNLDKEDDVTKYTIKKEVEIKGVKTIKAPKIQRLVTDRRLRRKKAINKLKKDQYNKIKRTKESWKDQKDVQP